MSIIPSHQRGLRRVVDVGPWRAPVRQPFYYRHMPTEVRGQSVRASLSLRWGHVLLNLSRRVHSTEALELGERVACQFGTQDIAAVLAPLRRAECDGTLF